MDLIWLSEKKKEIWCRFNLAIFAILCQLRQIFPAPKFIRIRYIAFDLSRDNVITVSRDFVGGVLSS